MLTLIISWGMIMPSSGIDMFAIDAFQLDGLIKLAIACVLGGILGMEREITRHPAGFRTHTLVALGSAGFMLLGFFLMKNLEGTYYSDPGRVVQGVITGMGFIGAGAIIKEGMSVHGITTAASLWVAGAVGLLVACGAMPLAIFMTLAALVILIISKRATRNLPGKTGNQT